MNDLAVNIDFCDNADAETMAHQQAVPQEDNIVQLSTDIQEASSVSLDAIEEIMLSEEQVDCPVQHHFGGGIYIRDGFIPAGTYIIGHSHKKETMNVLLRGKMAVFVNGEVKVIEGPFIFVSEPGRKFGYAIEDCNFQNIHPTEETDLEKIEETFIDKSNAWVAKEIEEQQVLAIDDAVKKYLKEIV
mgnify:CR=1 FL=1|tara:strand:- start:18 stop:578 length:561 start_codon:yes stop_codon:yes gene_type:complete